MASRKLVVYLEKGGVGKTMVAIHLSSALARMGKNVLLIDMDPQNQCRKRMGLRDAAEPKMTIVDVIRHGWPEGMSDKEKFASLVIHSRRKNLFLIPSHRDLSWLNFNMPAEVENWKGALQDALGFLDKWPLDYIIMDTNPSWSPLSALPLFWGRELVFPVGPTGDDVDGIVEFQSELEKVQRVRGGELEVVYILPNKFKAQEKESQAILEALKESFPEQICEPISHRVRLSECGSREKTIFEYAPSCPGAKEFMEFAKRVAEGKK